MNPTDTIITPFAIKPLTDHPLSHVKVSAGSEKEVIGFISDSIEHGQRIYSIPINLSKYCMAKDDPKLTEVIQKAHLVNADGSSIIWMAKRLGFPNVHRVTGVDLAEKVLALAAKKQWRVFLFGAKQETLEETQRRLQARFDGLQIVGSRNGYFRKNDEPGIVEQINQADADILLLGMGLPQKEYFLQDHFEQLNTRFSMPVGGAFDIWSDRKKRAPALVQTLGMEWLFRSFYDLSRAKLIFRYGLVFLKDTLFTQRKS